MADTIEQQPRGPRRLVWLGLAAAGTVVGIAFGVAVLQLPLGAPLVMVALGGMTLGLAALALWRVMEPILDTEPPQPAAPQEPVRIRDLQLEKQAVLKAIKEIELDYQMGKLTEADWRELTQRYRVRAMRLIGELEAGDDYRALIEQELKHRIAAREAQNQSRPPAAAGEAPKAGA